jgi:hypothetical protein
LERRRLSISATIFFSCDRLKFRAFKLHSRRLEKREKKKKNVTDDDDDDDDDDDEVHLYGAGLRSIECSLRIKKKGDKNSNDRTEKDKRRQLGAWQVQKQDGCN